MKRKLVFAIALFIVLTSGNFVSQKNDCTNKNTSVSAAETTGVYKGIKYTATDTEVTITGYTDDINPKTLIIPDYIDDKPVTSIEKYAFIELKLETIKLGRFITKIGSWAFSGRDLKEITLSDSLTDIGTIYTMDYFLNKEISMSDYDNNGRDYYNIEKIIIPENVKYLDKNFLRNEFFPKLSEFEVDDNNKVYSSVDGVLYDKNKKSMICFPRNKSIDRFIVPETVRRIEDGAIKDINSDKISYFDLGRNVTYIGVDAIRQILENTYELVLPANLEEFPDEEERKKIGMYTHKFYTGYKKLTIPSYVKYVHPFFIDCESHDHRSQGDLLNYIEVTEGNRFYKSHKGVLYNSDNTELIKCPCYTNLKEYRVLYGTTVIDSHSFANTKLETVTIPSTVKEIAGSAFKSDYQNTLTVKGYNNSYAEEFADEYNYQFISLGDPIVSGICNETIEWTLNRETGVLEISGNGEMDDYGSYSGVYQPWEDYIDDISAVIIHEGITAIGTDTFSNHINLEKVTLPESLEKIGACAFFKSFELNDINIPDNITYVDVDAFLNTKWYDTQPDGMLYIGKVAYKYKGKMSVNKKITIKDGTVEIAPYAFVDDTGVSYTNLLSVSMPDSVKTIRNHAFWRCTGLSEIKLSENLETIMTLAFNGCTSLKNFNLPESITRIDEMAFTACTSLSDLTIPESVTEIPSMAFAGCRGLKNVTVSSETNRIAPDAFQSCSRKIVLSVGENSYAAEYCEEQGINYSFDGGETLENYYIGKEYDINLDGVVNTSDFSELINIILEKDAINYNTFFYDVNDDGEINAADVITLEKIFLI